MFMLSNLRRGLLLLALVALLIVAVVPASAQTSATAQSTGTGSAAAFASNIGGVAFSQSASFGNAFAFSNAATTPAFPLRTAGTFVLTTGSTGAASAQAISGPAGSSVLVQAASLFPSTAFASGFATP
jgi:hypothetical protein